MAGETIAILNTTKQTVLGERIRVAETALSRMVGLLRDRGLEPGCGLLIYPSQAIHTVAMRFPIDVVYLDRDGTVVHISENLQPWRFARVCLEAASVLELPRQALAATGTVVGDKIEITLERCGKTSAR